MMNIAERSLPEIFLKAFLEGFSVSNFCFSEGAFVLESGDAIFDLLTSNSNAYERISSHQKYWQPTVPEREYGYDLDNPVHFRCKRLDTLGKEITITTVLFFKLPRGRLYMKFERFGTKKAKNILMHGINYMKTRLDTPKREYRKEKFAAFEKNFPENWNANSRAISYHQNRVGREVFLSKKALVKILLNSL